MQALSVLAREHAAIGALAVRFQAEIEALVAHGEMDGEAVDRLLAFFERQVDGHHQEKEERVLVPRLLARAMGAELGPLHALADEHTAQRELLAHVRNQVEGATYGEPISQAVLASGVRRYLRLQGEHSRWEQRTLFPLAGRLLGPVDDRAILLGFRLLDERWGAPVWDAACALAEWLDQRRALVPA